MPTGIAFIRGINVGGKNALPMATLRAICKGAGLENVATYIQSGNAAFTAPARTFARAAKAMEDGIEQEQGFRPRVVTRTLDDLRTVASAVPFQAEPAKLLVMFLTDHPAAAAKRALDQIKLHPERLMLIGREIFIHFPVGIGRSKLQMAAVEKAAGVPGTCRNWNTVMKMIEIGQRLG